MKNFSIFLIVLTIFSLSCNNWNKQQNSNLTLITKRALSDENRDFLFFIVPKIKKANSEILGVRQKILQIQRKYDSTGFISNRSRRRLNKTANSYNLKKLIFDQSIKSGKLKANINKLLIRVDIVPLKLVVAQACVESEWGRSRFAKEANNFFGVHCYKKGCGLPPQGVKNPTFEVKVYHSPEDAIEDYLRIINTGSAYTDLRARRAEMRSRGTSLQAIDLSNGLLTYSEKGEEYINLLKGIIINTLPENIDEIK